MSLNCFNTENHYSPNCPYSPCLSLPPLLQSSSLSSVVAEPGSSVCESDVGPDLPPTDYQGYQTNQTQEVHITTAQPRTKNTTPWRAANEYNNPPASLLADLSSLHLSPVLGVDLENGSLDLLSSSNERADRKPDESRSITFVAPLQVMSAYF